jgi:hypothetical protein
MAGDQSGQGGGFREILEGRERSEEVGGASGARERAESVESGTGDVTAAIPIG